MPRIAPTIALALLLAACSQPQPAAAPSGSATALSSGASASGAPPAPASATAATSAAAESRYTSLQRCKLVEAKEDEDWSISRCEAFGGFTLFLDYGDVRDDLRLVPRGGKDVHLGLPGLGGGGFNALGPNIEWRGVTAGGIFAPKALIVRDDVSFDPENAERKRSLLAVVDLSKPCVVALVPPGADQNQRARDIADRAGQACLLTS